MSNLVAFPRVWAMPSKHTFTIKPIRLLLDEEMTVDKVGWVDPFAGHNSPAFYRNDIDSECMVERHEDALEFLKAIKDGNAAGVLFDPPYSIEQAGRPYKVKGYGGTIGFTLYMGQCKDEIARIVEPGGKVICFGWDSGGMGKKRGFELVRGLLIAHGQRHDTIVTVEIKL